MQKNTCK